MISPFHLYSLNDIIQESIGILEPVYGSDAINQTRWIIADYLSLTHSQIRFDMDQIKIPLDKKNEINDRVKRRSRHEPLQYISGTVGFMGYEFAIGEGVLIPRNDTEILVEEAINIASKSLSTSKSKHFEFLELCTGSGCISISFIKKMQNIGMFVNGVATDISNDALAYASKNAKLLDCESQIHIVLHDIMTDPAVLIPDKNTGIADAYSFQLILANPPYIRTDIISSLDREVSEYEPLIALDGGEDGMLFYRRILKCSEILLAPGGFILLEIGYDQEKELTLLFDESRIFETISVKKDYGKNPRVLIAKKK